MKTNTKYKIISILLLSNLLFSTIGSHLLFKYLERQVKSEIKQHIIKGDYKEDYQKISVSYSEFLNIDWENHKEFIIGKNIYDVVDFEFNLDIIKITYFLDVKESHLRNNYALYLSSFLKQSSESKNFLFNFIEFALAKYVLNNNYFNLFNDFIKFNYFAIDKSKISSLIEIPNPPPQLSSCFY